MTVIENTPLDIKK